MSLINHQTNQVLCQTCACTKFWWAKSNKRDTGRLSRMVSQKLISHKVKTSCYTSITWNYFKQSPDWRSFSRTCGVTKKTRLVFQKLALLVGHIWPVISIVHSCKQFDLNLFKIFQQLWNCAAENSKMTNSLYWQGGGDNVLLVKFQQYYDMLLFAAWQVVEKEQQILSSLSKGKKKTSYHSFMVNGIVRN